MLPEARLSGLPNIERIPFYHEREHLILYQELAQKVPNLKRGITVYIGLETSIVAWIDGKVVDADNYVTGDSPMGVRSSGWLPNTGILSCFYEDERSLAEIAKLIYGQGGLKAYYGTEDLSVLTKKVGEVPFEAFIYWIAKGIGGMAGILKGKPEGIIIGGSWLKYDFFLRKLKKYISYLNVLESEEIR